MRIVLTFFLISGFLTACVHEPRETRASESHQRDGKLPWPEDAVILDVRKRFEYELGHWPKAYNLPAHEVARGDRDLKRRLALLGVYPAVTVVLVGDKRPDAIAEQLKALQLKHIRTFALNEVKLPLVREEPPPPKSQPVW